MLLNVCSKSSNKFIPSNKPTCGVNRFKKKTSNCYFSQLSKLSFNPLLNYTKYDFLLFQILAKFHL